jgi:hypothetical protein
MQAEIVALRHQLIVLQRTPKRKRLMLCRADRLLWVWLSHLWSGWRSALMIVKPETVLSWHRKGFRLYWTWKVRHGRAGRPRILKETRDLIRTMSQMNVLWGAPRIHSELLKLGINISQATVAKYMVRHRKPPSQTWRTFLNNHVSQLASIDFFTVPTVLFQVLFVFIVIRHDRRRIVHFNVTAHPTAEWTAQQIIEAFPFDSAPKYLLRDRDRIYGCEFRKQVEVMNIKEVLGAPPSPWRRAYVERVIGTFVVLNKSSNQALDEGMRYWHIGHCFDLRNAKDSKVRLPLMESIQSIMIRTQIFRNRLPRIARLNMRQRALPSTIPM